MVEMIKYIIKRISSFFLHVFWLFPVRKKKVFFMNDHSYNFSDNLKYLTLYLLEQDKDKYEIYFSLKNKQGTEDLPIKIVKWLSLSHFYNALTSGVVITNNGGTAYLPFRKKQLVINTWHGGGPYKMTGVRALTDCFDGEQTDKKDKSIKWYGKALAYNARKIDYILISCKMCIEETRGMFYKDEQALDAGNPRIDCLSDTEKSQSVRNKVFDRYGMDKNSKLVLYAPTFRGSFENYDGVIVQDQLEIDVQRTLEALAERFGGKWHFALRLHPRLRDAVIKADNIINMTSYPDPQELLMAADMLITDYSSIMWDFAFTSRPCLLFATDINDYSVRRGFYLSPEEWPFPLAASNDGLIENISNFDEASYLNAVKKHMEDVGSYETGHACERIKNIIDEHMKG